MADVHVPEHASVAEIIASLNLSSVSSLRIASSLWFSYATDGGSRVAISKKLNPYKVLGVSCTDCHSTIKEAFRRQFQTSTRQRRAEVSLSYYILDKAQFIGDSLDTSSVTENQFFYASAGNTSKLRGIFSRNKRTDTVNDYDHNGCTVLYIAARGGFYDTCRYILSLGVDVNHRQKMGSTALHAAAYFGHAIVVGLLLQSGADPTIRNISEHTAEDEQSNPDVLRVILCAKEDMVAMFATDCVAKDIKYGTQFIRYPSEEGEIIGKELRNKHQRHLRIPMSDIRKEWVPAWHGTKLVYLQSILKKWPVACWIKRSNA